LRGIKGLNAGLTHLRAGKFFFFKLARFTVKRTFVTFNTFWADPGDRKMNEISLDDLGTMERVILAIRQSEVSQTPIKVSKPYRSSLGTMVDKAVGHSVRRLDEKYGESIDKNALRVQMWQQAWVTNPLGTNLPCLSNPLCVVTVENEGVVDVFVYINFNLAYHIANPSEAMQQDIDRRCIVAVNDQRRFEYEARPEKKEGSHGTS
jgi:hypothetical protein